MIKSNVLPLVTEPDPRLHQRSQEITEINENIKQLMLDMHATMLSGNGIGLAAVQVGRLVKLIVVDVKEEGLPGPIFMINPEIIKKSEEKVPSREGCLSIPTITAEIERYKWVIVRYRDEEYQERERLCEGLFGICVQHEIDHSNGILFLDYLSPMKRDIFKRKLAKIKKISS
jgi:peptide deformylase